MDYIVNHLIQGLINNKTINEEDSELYHYGLKQGIIIIINLLTIALIGLVTDRFWIMVVYAVLYIPLRSYAGGYHAKSALVCYLYSVGALICIAVLSGLLFTTEGSSLYIVFIISCLIVGILSPVEDSNKPLDAIEKKVYGRRVLILLLVYTGVFVISNLIGIVWFTWTLNMAVASTALLVALGNLKNLSLFR